MDYASLKTSYIFNKFFSLFDLDLLEKHNIDLELIMEDIKSGCMQNTYNKYVCISDSVSSNLYYSNHLAASALKRQDKNQILTLFNIFPFVCVYSFFLARDYFLNRPPPELDYLISVLDNPSLTNKQKIIKTLETMWTSYIFISSVNATCFYQYKIRGYPLEYLLNVYREICGDDCDLY